MRREPSGGSARNTRRWVGAIAVIALAITAALSVGSAGAKSSKPAQAKATTNLTMWFWGNDDAPGADKWLAAAVKSYEAKNPNIKIKVVTQPVATFIATFQAAAAAKSGPRHRRAVGDRAGPDAGLGRRDHGDLRPRSEVRDEELAEHGREHLRRQDLGDAALPDRDPLDVQQGAHEAGRHHRLPGHQVEPDHLVLQDAAREEHRAVRVRQRHLLDDAADDAGPEQARATSWTPTPARRASPTKKYAHFEDGWKQMVDAKCFNDDVSSVPLAKGQQAFDAGKAAMTIATDGQARTFAKDLGGDSKVTVAKWPVFGTGALKNVYNATQSTSYFVTSWSKHKKEGAAFLTYLHTAAQLKAWYAATGTPPADKRFDTSAIKGALDKKLYAFNTTGKQIWLQNFFPPQVDLNGNAPAQQQLLGGRGDGAAAAAIRERAAKQWRAQQAAQLKNWQAFKPV